jgi:hypothetical protein
VSSRLVLEIFLFQRGNDGYKKQLRLPPSLPKDDSR